MPDTKGIILPKAVEDKIRTQVNFESDEQIVSFVLDALNSYLEMGRLSGSGAQFFISGNGQDMRRMRFPFENLDNN